MNRVLTVRELSAKVGNTSDSLPADDFALDIGTVIDSTEGAYSCLHASDECFLEVKYKDDCSEVPVVVVQDEHSKVLASDVCTPDHFFPNLQQPDNQSFL